MATPMQGTWQQNIRVHKPGQAYTMLVTMPLPSEPSVVHEAALPNPYPYSIYLRDINLWQGAAKYSAQDIWSRVWICDTRPDVGMYDPPMVIWSHNWDRYIATSWHPKFEDRIPSDCYYELPVGGWLTFNTSCAKVYLEGEVEQINGFQAQFLVKFNTVRPGTNEGPGEPVPSEPASVQLVVDGRTIGLVTTAPEGSQQNLRGVFVGGHQQSSPLLVSGNGWENRTDYPDPLDMAKVSQLRNKR